MNGFQCFRELRHADRLEQVRNDLILDARLCVFKVVIAAQKCDLKQRLYRLCLPRQRCPGDEGHPDVGQKEVRLKLLDEL